MRRILCIDGGGIKGVFAASFLATLESKLPHSIGRYFDLIVGTSSGGIIALGLGAGLSASDLVRFYESAGPQIFENQGRLARLTHFIRGKHDSLPLKSALTAALGGKRLGDSQVRLAIPSQNLETGEVHIFKTSHHERFATDHKNLMVDVALATSAAPTYFPTHKLPLGTPLIDGGLWANNPCGVAAVEAVSILNWNRADTWLLSLSCTRTPISVEKAHTFSAGKLYWARKLLEVVGAGQSSGSLGTAKHLLGHQSVYRVEPVVSATAFELDKADAIDRLKGLGASEARTHGPHLQEYLKDVAEAFVPFHSLNAAP